VNVDLDDSSPDLGLDQPSASPDRAGPSLIVLDANGSPASFHSAGQSMHYRGLGASNSSSPWTSTDSSQNTSPPGDAEGSFGGMASFSELLR